jgi:hypothetical protein
MSEARIWYSRNADQATLPCGFENEIVLSPEFFREVLEHPIPTDMEAAKALSCSPAALDLFTWLSYRRESLCVKSRSLFQLSDRFVSRPGPRVKNAKLGEQLGLEFLVPVCPRYCQRVIQKIPGFAFLLQLREGSRVAGQRHDRSTEVLIALAEGDCLIELLAISNC